MPRYYFDLRDGKHLIQDEEGMDLPDMEAVRNEAARALVDLARDSIRSNSANLVIEARDENGPVMRARFEFDIERLQ
ncbi:DUF6894 family protein (plasmid) [Bradyrhizobium sp. PMVTL-01]|uniref:DUF6894 family protein n=1 Tax=Bradyrhizobium sp. PMVTL-01 TaxID=3434999 RepID=UPI003F70B41E